MSIAGIIIAVVFLLSACWVRCWPAGATLIWLGMLVYGFFVKFQNLPWTFYAGQGLAVC